MLRPQDNRCREAKSLDGQWEFRIDWAGVGREQHWEAGRLADSRPMAVPASYQDLFTDAATHDFFGDAWYQREIVVPASWAGRTIALYFESATHTADVWVAGRHVGHHEGGYLPFECDLTDVVAPGSSALVTVAVNNELSWQTIPPGVVVTSAAGERRLNYFHDFYNYSGIHRTVWLVARPAAGITDVTVVPSIEGTTGRLAYTVEAGSDAGIRAELRTPEGEVVATSSGAEGTLEVTDAHLWDLGDGYLYTLEVTLGDPDEPEDCYRLTTGIRTVAVRGAELLLNGHPVRLTGFGMHEDHATVGKQHNDALWIRDFELLKWVGANSFRTSHYPYSEHVLDLADRAGILVISETPAVGQNTGLVGGIFGGVAYTTFSPDTINDDTQALHRRMLDELVARDKNHPCVAIWSVANEPESDTEASEAYFKPLIEHAQAIDPQRRPVGFVNVMLSPHGRCRVSQYCDVIMLNRYWGWYVQTGDLASAKAAARSELAGWASEGKPIIMTEYGADTVPGLHELPAAPWSEEYEVAYLAANHEVFDEFPEIVGRQMWNFADFRTTAGIMRVGGNKKGVFTRDRQPKAAAHYLRSVWAAKA